MTVIWLNYIKSGYQGIQAPFQTSNSNFKLTGSASCTSSPTSTLTTLNSSRCSSNRSRSCSKTGRSTACSRATWSRSTPGPTGQSLIVRSRNVSQLLCFPDCQNHLAFPEYKSDLLHFGGKFETGRGRTAKTPATASSTTGAGPPPAG